MRALENFKESAVRGQGRNARTVWEIATEPYAEAHFATYPTALVKRCILAGMSEHGCCAECGAPWERIVQRSAVAHDVEESPYPVGAGKRMAQARDSARARSNYDDNPFAPPKTKGWQPRCKHAADAAPCIVLDPFMGSGTTALVALTAFRDYIGIELNPAYVEMAEERVAELRDQGRLL